MTALRKVEIEGEPSERCVLQRIVHQRDNEWRNWHDEGNKALVSDKNMSVDTTIGEDAMTLEWKEGGS